MTDDIALAVPGGLVSYALMELLKKYIRNTVVLQLLAVFIAGVLSAASEVLAQPQVDWATAGRVVLKGGLIWLLSYAGHKQTTDRADAPTGGTP